MGMKFGVIFLAVLMQFALSTFAETNYFPGLRKLSRKSPSSFEGDSRVLFLVHKPTKRPNKVNIVYINVPTGSTPPDPQTTPKPQTTTSTPSPKPPHGHYPHYLPFLPPIFVPVPGWTGNPPPPYVPPNRPNKPPTSNLNPHPADPPVGLLSAPGTPTTASDEIGDWLDEKVENSQLLQDSGSNLLNIRRKPKPTKKPRPSRKPSTTTIKPDSEDLISEPDSSSEIVIDSVVDMQGQRKKKPRPSRKPRPSKKPVQAIEKPDNLGNEEMGVDIVKPDSLDLEGDSLENRNKKPRPSKKPTQIIEKPDYEESELEVTDVQEQPMLDEEGSGEIDDDLLVNRKKKPRPSRKPKPSKKPQVTVEESNNESPPVLYGVAADDALKLDGDLLISERPIRKPELVDKDPDSTESLGPEKDLIVVQRKGKPMKIRLATRKVFSPWQLLKFPKNDDWQRSLQRIGGVNYFFVA